MLRSGHEDDLAPGVTSLQLAVGVGDIRQGVHPGDRNLEGPLADERRQLGKDLCARTGEVAVSLHAVLLRRLEARDGVDPIWSDTESECELDVVCAEGVDKGIDSTVGSSSDA